MVAPYIFMAVLGLIGGISLFLVKVDSSSVDSASRIAPWARLLRYRWFRYAGACTCLSLAVLSVALPLGCQTEEARMRFPTADHKRYPLSEVIEDPDGDRTQSFVPYKEPAFAERCRIRWERFKELKLPLPEKGRYTVKEAYDVKSEGRVK